MKRHLLFISAVAVVGMLATDSLAQAQAKPPAGSTAACRDGSFSTDANRETACSANRGVREWLSNASAASAAAAPEAQRKAPVPKTADGRTMVNVPESKVIADPATKMYQLCVGEDEREVPAASGAASGKRAARPPGDLMSEDEAKAKGFRPGAHKVNCAD